MATDDGRAGDRVGGRGEEGRRISRRSLLAGGAALGAAGAVSGLLPGSAALIEKAAAATPAGSSLDDVEHVIILMQENRSFDHYFGTLSGVRGFGDLDVRTQTVNGVSYPIWDQFGYQPGVGPDADGYLQPFRLVTDLPKEDGQSTNDITHSWAPQHQSWNNGAMNNFIRAHLAADGAAHGPVTMGYFTRADLPFYYALADAFTICDSYFCSVLGPTDPNRLMSVSASIDPGGTHGGPVVETFSDRLAETGKLKWETMPERLLSAGVSWKVYNGALGLEGLNPFPYFAAYDDLLSLTGLELVDRALTPTYPGTFDSDVKSAKLPSVSWIIPPLAECEHPAAPPDWGEYLVNQILATLVANPDVWAKTVLFITYDENGGFFDHVAPVTPPAGTAGEYLTANPLPSAAGGIAGPIGLGFRVPCLVVSPYSTGGYVSHDTFDHTSLLRFIETRFGVEVPNLSAWRRRVTGDLTSTLRLSSPAVTALPSLPPTAIGGNTAAVAQQVLDALTGTLDDEPPYPIPDRNSMPAQETSPPRPVV
ncbi:MAG TPA: alkaline phosphatase family protein [Acidimicrobiales bacterium]|nr:alkaline phosphatase family protein [Acidimicrobiales bacterium]